MAEPGRWRSLGRQWACALLCAAALGASATTVLDDRQQSVHIERMPQRIVSLLPSLTETVCALGQCDRLVGVDRYSNWPERVRDLPRMGGGLDPNIERIVAQKPDLVLLAGPTRGAERLQALGIVVLRLEPRTQADVQRVLRTVAMALGLPEAQAERVWREIDAGCKRRCKRCRRQRGAGVSMWKWARRPMARANRPSLARPCSAWAWATSCRRRWGRSHRSTRNSWCAPSPM